MLALLQQAAPLSPNSGALTPEQFRQQIALEALRNAPYNRTGAGIIVPLAFFALIALLVWLFSRAATRAQIECLKPNSKSSCWLHIQLGT